jgi:hypothetical protein
MLEEIQKLRATYRQIIHEAKTNLEELDEIEELALKLMTPAEMPELVLHSINVAVN